MPLTPNLLINNQSELAAIPSKVINANHTSHSNHFVAARNRGTSIKAATGGYGVVTWQKNIASLQRMDVALPTIVTIRMDADRTITDIGLDDSFAGSQGLACNHKYLNKVLKHTLIGRPFDLRHTKYFSLSYLHCFHLQETLFSALSFFEAANVDQDGLTDEVEVVEAIEMETGLSFTGNHRFSNGTEFQWELTLDDIQNKFKFMNLVIKKAQEN